LSLEQTINNIHGLLATLERCARVGFQNGIEPARAVTVVFQLRIDFGLMLGCIPEFTPEQLTEFQIDLAEFLTRLEARVSPLLTVKSCMA
jgi:hypothetical protein